MMGSAIDRETNEVLAAEITAETKFDPTRDELYFFVREGFSNTRLSEGFVQNVKVTSEMLNGEMIVDGWLKFDLSIGDSIMCEAHDDFALTGIKIK